MNDQHQPAQHFLSCKLKPISVILFLICAQSSYAQELNGANSIDAITGEPSKTTKPIDVPSVATQYGATKEILKTADVSDAKAQGTGKTDSQGKPVATKSTDIELKAVEVRAKRFYEIGPLGGLGLTKEEIPGNVQSVTAKDIKDSHALSLTDLLNSKLQSVNVNDYQGNPFQMDVTYRGFTAGPQIGTPQGLSVFFDGIRVNEPFGDVVNWDMIPMNALAGVDVFPGSNPIFGLNTLGGAFAMKTKSGFDSEGVDMEVLTGSYGRKQLQASGGWNNGVVGLFGAGNFFLEDGWRDNSPSKVNQVFGKASYRGDKLDLNFSTLIAWNDLVGNGLLPSQMYEQNRNGVFSSPDTTKNRLMQFQLSADYFVSDNFTVTSQVYHRKSKRKSIGADVYTDYEDSVVRRSLNPGEEYTCLFNSTNKYGLPDYYVYDEQTPGDFFSSSFFADAFDGDDFIDLTPLGAKNPDINTAGFVDLAKFIFNQAKNPRQELVYIPQGGGLPTVPNSDPTSYSNGESVYNVDIFALSGTAASFNYNTPVMPNYGTYFYTPDGLKHYVFVEPPANLANCLATQQAVPEVPGEGPLSTPVAVDGAGSSGPGVVEGTPTAIINNNEIDQIVDGGSLQLNWNFEKHKFMVGVSIDAAHADYTNGQRLGFLDAQRNAYLDSDQARDQYAAADMEVSFNNFSGTTTTKSIYASETWSPIDTLHITGAARYNDTKVKNKLSAQYGFIVLDLAGFESLPDYFNICTNGNCPTGYKLPDLSNLLNPPETEKFSFYSLNPSFGVAWQAKENLNVYGNWSQGTRTPSVIELGCAFDSRPSGGKTMDGNGNIIDIPKTIAENRFCSLPSSLSGDPYLPQIKAETFEVGMRGSAKSMLGADNLEWNISAYQTALKDDIYLVAFGDGRSFFDSIGKTRRQGLETGLSATFGKARFNLNYALTDATFQDTFELISPNNSSANSGTLGSLSSVFNSITVKPGNRMPGVPLHNLNATLSYDLTSKWNVGLTAVAHSGSYVRGNENNKHQQGVTTYISQFNPVTHLQELVARQPSSNPGTVPGYATFNFNTSYKLASEWTLGMQVSNLFDKEYFTAGRLGRNPFSPSINGAIGPDGYNHNSADWLSTNFIAPSAPRGVWLSLNWQFDPNKK